MSLKLNPPSQMTFSTEDGNLSERWRVWQESIELYLDLAMKSSGENEKCKAVLYIIGEEGRKIYNTWSIPVEDREKVQPLLKRFKEYCTPRNNITLERYKFNTHGHQFINRALLLGTMDHDFYTQSIKSNRVHLYQHTIME